MYSILTKVIDVREIKRTVSGRKVEDGVEYEIENLGYFVLFEGSHERLFLSLTEPTLKAGDQVKITIQKVETENAIPSKPSI